MIIREVANSQRTNAREIRVLCMINGNLVPGLSRIFKSESN